MMDFINAQHCLAIAGAFIAIVAVCATLVGASNSKSDALVERYRGVTKEFREEPKDSRRKIQLEAQIALFAERVQAIYRSQQCLFWAIICFILSIALFVYIGLHLAYIVKPNATFDSISQKLLLVIGGLVTGGTVLMLIAVRFYFRELKDAKRTFEIETQDCRKGKTRLRLLRAREGYGVSCSDQSICWVQGETKEEAMRNIREIALAYLD